ncbi:MAG TPA: sugar nucleotide-binding protein [Microthrixaceae bacterium]|nr:sugar nucleotide-binding protein [Microthrixaceae bacterium]
MLVTGGAGTVAGWLVRTAPAAIDLHVTEHRSPVPDHVRTRATVHRSDLRRRDEVGHRISEIAPDVVVHTAYLQGERAAIVDATAAVAAAAASVGASMLQLSTDVVFAGDRPPYDESSEPDPVSDYGRWKAEAERRAAAILADVCITRTSLVVSIDPPDRATAGLVEALRARRPITLFHDEMRQPIRAEDLAAELWALVALDRADRTGVWHLPGPEHLSRSDIGLRLARRLGLDPSPVAVGSAADHPSPRPRDPALVSRRRQVLGVQLQAVDA